MHENRQVAVYCITRNLYRKVTPSLVSLLMHTRMDKVYLLIEDDQLPFALPENVECINVSRQTYFKESGPNYKCRWSWMALMRAALPYVLPDEHVVLSLDADTIIVDDISPMFSMPLDGYYFAGVEETHKSWPGRMYCNAGAILLNLDMLRNGKADEIIAELNTRFHAYPEQDVMNDLCKNHILSIPSDYNVTSFTKKTNAPKIVHFAAIDSWWEQPLVRAFATMKCPDCEKKLIECADRINGWKDDAHA